MKKALVIIFNTLFSFYMFGQNAPEYYKNGNIKFEQKVRNDSTIKYRYYENGKNKNESYYDINGTWIGYKVWAENGGLKEFIDFVKERKEKGPIDLSFIKWNRLDSIEIFISSDLINVGNSKELKNGDTIVFHYMCLDDQGYEYDNSITRNEPINLVVGKTPFLKSFLTCISRLKVGNKAYFRIPPKYGYGDKPAGNVPPNTTLVYYVEIFAIKQ